MDPPAIVTLTLLLTFVLTSGSARSVAAEEHRKEHRQEHRPGAASQDDTVAAFARAKEEWQRAISRAYASQDLANKGLPAGAKHRAPPGPMPATPEMLVCEQMFIAHLRARVGDASIGKVATPLFVEAVRLGMVNVVQALLQAGADPNAPPGEALRDAITRSSPEMVQTLLRGGADANARAKDGLSDTRTPLIVYAAARSRLHPVGVVLVRALLEHGAEVDSVVVGGPWSGSTALIKAAGRGNLEIVELLLSKGADANHVIPDSGHTPLMSGAGYPDVAATLLKSGAKLQAKDHAKRTPIIFAAMAGCEPAVEFLRKRGGDMKQRDRWGTSAREYLRDFGKDSVRTGVCAPEAYQW